MTPAVDADEMQIALKLVQSLDPCGVGARSVSECLQLQLGCIDDAERARARRGASSPTTSTGWPSTTSTAWRGC